MMHLLVAWLSACLVLAPGDPCGAVDMEAVPEPTPTPSPSPHRHTTPAPAIPEPWASIAECESGSDWDINTGNSFYGGLQFNQLSWEWAGGLDYAPRADLATPMQQVAVARALREIHPAGLGAWPACTRALGLR